MDEKSEEKTRRKARRKFGIGGGKQTQTNHIAKCTYIDLHPIYLSLRAQKSTESREAWLKEKYGL
jgi:hypothetical protein